MKRDRRVLTAVFRYLDDLLPALEELKKEGIDIHTVYSPAPHEKIGEALGKKPSLVRFFTLAGGVLGVILGFVLSVFTAIQWRFIVSGKPPVPLPPYVIVSFEFCILLGVLLNLAGVLLLGRMPRFRLPEHYDPRFSEDRYGLVVICAEERKPEVTQLLEQAGAEEVRDVQP